MILALVRDKIADEGNNRANLEVDRTMRVIFDYLSPKQETLGESVYLLSTLLLILCSSYHLNLSLMQHLSQNVVVVPSSFVVISCHSWQAAARVYYEI